VSFNERFFPARANNTIRPIAKDKGEKLIGTKFTQDDETFVITNCSYHQGEDCLDYKNTDTNEEHYSTVKEVTKWVKESNVLQLANNIQPSRKGFMNTLAETMFKAIQPKTYNVKLPSNTIKPPKSFNEARGREEQWFEAFRKERDGMLRFNTWHRLDQTKVTPDMRQHALRAQHIYNIKRDGSAKVRVVVNGKR
jgi:hypothetical protein